MCFHAAAWSLAVCVSTPSRSKRQAWMPSESPSTAPDLPHPAADRSSDRATRPTTSSSCLEPFQSCYGAAVGAATYPDQLRAAGLRVTAARVAVLEALTEATDHPRVDQ